MNECEDGFYEVSQLEEQKEKSNKRMKAYVNYGTPSNKWILA